MSNHIHLVAHSDFHDSIHQVFQWCRGVYVKYFNEKYSLSGHLWEQRPFSCVLSEDHVRNALRYVENNPVRAGMVNSATDYRWSSARAHGFGFADPLLTGDDRVAILAGPGDSMVKVTIPR
jgi:putative transposase